MRVVIVGAGMSGLVAATELQAAGAAVAVVDKGRSPGGRLATRRIGDATVDHGAQFFTVRTPAFQHRVDDWLERDLVTVWSHGFDATDGHPRYVAPRGMTSLAKDLATGLDVSCSTMAFAVRSTDSNWEVVIDDGSVRVADRVIVTTPLPQAFALLGRVEVAHGCVDHRQAETLAVPTVLFVVDVEMGPALVVLQREQRGRARFVADAVDIRRLHRTGADDDVVADLVPIERPGPHRRSRATARPSVRRPWR